MPHAQALRRGRRHAGEVLSRSEDAVLVHTQVVAQVGAGAVVAELVAVVHGGEGLLQDGLHGRAARRGVLLQGGRHSWGLATRRHAHPSPSTLALLVVRRLPT